MRLDKYLKVSRLVKRRTVAKEICDAGRVLVNGRQAKAGTECEINDVLTIRYGQKTTQVRVLSVAEAARKDQAHEMYEVLTEHDAN
ncbi:RNA-binding S4 domain-containing protein [Alicyclobacillus sp. SO9]|uniref:RNA-binding S4 domain-containing protein n=1 Tax=Alicyclobacillus sp. SO9 TaxID=2665646 RepID=UPI0018E86875|nr:RNA-binding S4 domain-containing protein [Alicyclobacillus sp. SO9]QQE79414.1 RNA-binding S4 domain-containing protein [Alicyclobacillus sp. SO9]